MSELPQRSRFEGKPSELVGFLKRLGDQSPETQVRDSRTTIHLNTTEPTSQPISQTHIRSIVQNTPRIVGRDFTDQKWLHDYQTRLRRGDFYRKMENMITLPVRTVLGFFGYRETFPVVFSAGRDVSQYLRASRLLGLYKLKSVSC